MLNIFATLALVFFSVSSFATESTSEKAGATVNDAKRAVKKGAHKVQEAVCMEGDVKCLAKKAKNRTTEAGEYVGDKAKQGADKIDNNETVNQ